MLKLFLHQKKFSSRLKYVNIGHYYTNVKTIKNIQYMSAMNSQYRYEDNYEYIIEKEREREEN